MTGDSYDFALPGQWLTLDLQGDARLIERRIRSVVDRAVGPRDDLASMRAQLRADLSRVADEGRVVKAEKVYLAQSIAGSVPFPASLFVCRPGVVLPVAPSAETARQELFSLTPGVDVIGFDHRDLVMTRSLGSRAESSEPGMSATEHLSVEYWLHAEGDNHLIVFTFTCPLSGLHDELLTLFDAVMLTLRRRSGVVTGGKVSAGAMTEGSVFA